MAIYTPGGGADALIADIWPPGLGDHESLMFNHHALCGSCSGGQAKSYNRVSYPQCDLRKLLSSRGHDLTPVAPAAWLHHGQRCSPCTCLQLESPHTQQHGCSERQGGHVPPMPALRHRRQPEIMGAEVNAGAKSVPVSPWMRCGAASGERLTLRAPTASVPRPPGPLRVGP